MSTRPRSIAVEGLPVGCVDGNENRRGKQLFPHSYLGELAAMSFLQIQPAAARKPGLLAWLLFFHGFVGWSVIWQAVEFPIAAGSILLVLVVALVSIAQRRRTPAWAFWGVFLLVGLSAIPALFWWNTDYLYRHHYFFLIALVLLAHASPEEIDLAIDIGTVFVCILLVGSLFGSCWAILGESPLFFFPRPNSPGQFLYVYPFTLAQEIGAGSIRANGIYDEPGAFSFLICSLACLRHLRGRSSVATWALLLVGFVTLSLAHLLFVATFTLATPFSRKQLLSLGAALTTAFLAYTVTPFGDVLEERLLERLVGEQVEEGRIVAGDNRSNSIDMALRVAVQSPEAVWFGMDVEHESDYARRRIAENPLSPVVRYGFLLAWPYYAYLILGFWMLLKGRKNLVFFAMVLVLCQRPYINANGYALLALLVLWAQWNRSIRVSTTGARCLPS